MKHLVLSFLLGAAVLCAQVTPTTLTGPLISPISGESFTGSLTIAAPYQMTCSGAIYVPASYKAFVSSGAIVTVNGQVQALTLMPNDQCTVPAGKPNQYTVAFAPAGQPGIGWTGYAIVPTSSGPITLMSTIQPTQGTISTGPMYSFNGHTGAVTPQTGDYTAAMTGATADPHANGIPYRTALGAARIATISDLVTLGAASLAALAPVATSGSYADLSNKPAIPTNPMTTAGDFLIGGASGAFTRLGTPGNGTFCPSWSGGAVSWITCPSGTISSIGLTMPAAFAVSGSPLTANGMLVVTGTGTSSQYVLGTGALATFPTTWGWASLTGLPSLVNTLNGQAGAIALGIGTAGTSPGWSTSTLNIPLASASGVTAGLLSNASYASFAAKQSAISGAPGTWPTFSMVATSGSYSDLGGKPTIPAAQVNSDWASGSGLSQILNKPTIPPAQVQTDWNATAGMGVLLNKPAIPAAQINADWAAGSGPAQILNKPTIPSGSLPVVGATPVDAAVLSYNAAGTGVQDSGWKASTAGLQCPTCSGPTYFNWTEGTAPLADPGSGNQWMFIDSSDHLAKLKNHAGTITALGGSGGSGGLADPGNNGLVKRTALNTTVAATAGTDYYKPGTMIGDADLPFPGTTAKGGILTTACTGGQVATGYKADGTPSCATVTASGFNPLDTTQKWIVEPFCDSGIVTRQIGANGWQLTGTAGAPDSAAGYPCQMKATTATTANSIGSMYLGGDTSKLLPDVGFATATNYGAVFKFQTPASLTEVKLKIGFKIGATDTDNPFVGAKYTSSTGCTANNSTDTTWMLETANASVTAAAGPSIAPSTWYTLSIANGSTPGQVTMKMATAGGAWSTPVTSTTNFPGTGITPVFQVVTCAATANSITAGYFGYLQTGLPQ